jgi:LacI family transcriptional regulator
MALAKANIPFDPGLITCAENFSDVHTAALHLLDASHPVTAVFCVNDMAAIDISNRLASLGLKIPQDIALVGFDNLPVAERHYPSISTVDQPFHEIGRRAAELALHLLDGTFPVGNLTITLPISLIVRESSHYIVEKKDRH